MKAAWAALLLLFGCDNSQAIHELDPDLNRMLVQPRAEAYAESDWFKDGKVMQAPPRGTVPYGKASEERPPTTSELLAEGRRHFETICATCHGVDGSGVSVVATKMPYRTPPAFDEPRLLLLSDDAVYRVVTEGYGFMPSYSFMLSAHERWAVVGYVSALKLSRHAVVKDLPAGVRDKFAEAVR